ncbi:hypothetical protein LTR10_007331 [Elasticomyces elasticus]|nr:hypothetical protein LTR10_007331 [Elasticomyces elasticus]KAK4979143.1 hypothetical protein LTR42_001645 [Elasticomyces elasticus]
MNNTNSTRGFSFIPITLPQQGVHERTTNMSTPTSSSVAFDTSSNLLHVRASGHKTRPEELYTEDDGFVQDFHRQQDTERMEESVDPNEFDYLDGESVYEDAEEADLFSRSFPNVKEEEEEDGGDEIEIIEGPDQTKTNAKSKRPATNYHDAVEHTSGCNHNHNSRSASTPPPPTSTITSPSRNNPKPTPVPALTQKKPEEADFVKDLRRSLTQQRKLHDKAKLFTPRLPLDAHRYWVCVLHEGRKVSTIGRMKANRFTTIATIWHTHATTTLSNGFVLLLGHERVDFKDCLGELDYFHDKFVCLRAVAKDSEQAKGKELGEGCPAEVSEIIELD